jgi:hypothetical protein
VTRSQLPDFFIIGAPKAGTTALHAAIARHPGLFLAAVKEPKFFLCDEQPPERSAQRGPGDAHSAREWIWRRDRYEQLFAGAPPGVPRGESTPFYLSDPRAQERIHQAVPDARSIVVIRDPVDRAYSNWMHLRSDGLEPEPDFLRAFHAEDSRRTAGWAPFWRYRSLGLYGKQLTRLYERFDREQVHVLRYRQLVDSPQATLAGVCRFLGVDVGGLDAPPAVNARSFVADTARTRNLSRVVRAGAVVGQLFPPQAWRVAQRPLLRALQHTDAARPQLSPEQRREAVAAYADDIGVLERLTADSYQDWLGDRGRGSFLDRRAGHTEPADQTSPAGQTSSAGGNS